MNRSSGYGDVPLAKAWGVGRTIRIPIPGPRFAIPFVSAPGNGYFWFMDGKISHMVLWFLLAGGLGSAVPTAAQEPVLQIMYTGNINAALDDCRCGDENVGGLTRVATILRSAQRQYPHLLVLDAGDWFNSYSQSLLNLFLLRMMRDLPYNALNVGDQELVESVDFLFDAQKLFPGEIPLVSTNLQVRREVLPWRPLRQFPFPQIRVHLFAVADSSAFDFISPGFVRVESPLRALQKWLPPRKGDRDFYLLLFHGRWERARRLVRHFPGLDLVILAHQQQQRGLQIGSTLLVEAGTEGQWVGQVTVRKNGTFWRMRSRFIPVTQAVAEDPVMKELALECYRKLNQLQEGDNETQQSH